MKRFFFFFLINVACCSSMVKAFDYINYKGLVLSAHDNHLAIRVWIPHIFIVME